MAAPHGLSAPAGSRIVCRYGPVPEAHGKDQDWNYRAALRWFCAPTQLPDVQL